ncbi:MAG: hypothetical protein WC144_05030 [Sulfurimonas sp.]|jgi:hypothetical protein
MPKTDPRVRDYTYLDMIVEFLSDALDSEIITIDENGKINYKIGKDGKIIYKTNDPEIDKLEEELAEGNDEDILRELQKSCQKINQ